MKYGISQQTIKELIQKTDIVSLIENHVRLKPAGRNFLGLCPFHNEKTPSFHVSQEKKFYHCFGCGAHGDAISFLMEIDRLSFVESVKQLALKANLSLDFNETSVRFLSKSDFQLLVDAKDYFSRNLIEVPDNPCLKYIEEREISDTSVKLFQLGYAPDGWGNLMNFLVSKGYEINDLERLGLIKKGEKGNFYDRLRNRLIFPVLDHLGKIIGFSGRSIDGNDPKYLNPPETEYYKKSSIFYGIFEAKDAIRKQRRVFIVEGYLDVIRLQENGFPESIATCGTSLTVEHIQVLEKMRISRVYLVFDGDSAGIAAAEKTAKMFLRFDIECRSIILPDQLDPDEFFKKYTSKDFNLLIEESKLDYIFLIENALKLSELGGIDERAAFVEELSELGHAIKNKAKQGFFFHTLAFRFGLKDNFFKKYFETREESKKESNLDQSKSFGDWKNSKFKYEIEALFLLLSWPKQSYEILRENLSSSDFTNPSLKNLFSRLYNLSESELASIVVSELGRFFIEHSKTIEKILSSKIIFKENEITENIIKRNVIYKLKKEKILAEYLTMEKIDEKRAVSQKNENLRKLSNLLQ